MFLVVSKAPAILVHQSTGSVLGVFTETGVYFVHDINGSSVVYVSSLVLSPKSVNVPIPGELTDIVGGYYREERSEPLIDTIIPAGGFELVEN